MATRLGKWFAKNSMQHNHDETDMPGMPETPGVDLSDGYWGGHACHRD